MEKKKTEKKLATELNAMSNDIHVQIFVSGFATMRIDDSGGGGGGDSSQATAATNSQW